MSIITLDELIDDINKSSDKQYSFLRVLKRSDRALFLSRIREDEYDYIYNKKKIKLNTWLNIMSQIKLSSRYKVYRKGYKGECSGNKRISETLTNYVVPLWTFDEFYPSHESEKNWIKNWISGFFHMIMNDTPTKHILLYDNAMEEFEFATSKYVLSSWDNIDYKIKDEYC